MFTGANIDAERADEFKRAGANMSVMKPLHASLVRQMLSVRSSFIVNKVPPAASILAPGAAVLGTGENCDGIQTLDGIESIIAKRRFERDGLSVQGEMELIAVEKEVEDGVEHRQVMALPSMAIGPERRSSFLKKENTEKGAAENAHLPAMVVRGVKNPPPFL